MSYFAWEDLVAKYRKLEDSFDSSAINSYWAPRVSANVDGLVGQRFTVPFTPTPLLISDLAVDLCYWEMTYKEENQTILKDYIDERVTGLLNGTITLTDPTGAPLAGAPRVFLTTSGTASSFGMDHVENFRVDSNWQASYAGARGDFCD